MTQGLDVTPNRLFFQLDAVEYDYFREAERLSRCITFLAYECSVKSEFFHEPTINAPYAKIGVRVTGIRHRCLYFGVFFAAFRKSMARLRGRITVAELKDHPSFRNFLPVSPEAYTSCHENRLKMEEMKLDLELRPPGPCSAPLIRISGPVNRCRELWERHLRAIPCDTDNSRRAARDPPIAEIDPVTKERRRNMKLIGREVDDNGIPLDGEPEEDVPIRPGPPSEDESMSAQSLDSQGRQKKIDTNVWPTDRRSIDSRRSRRSSAKGSSHRGDDQRQSDWSQGNWNSGQDWQSKNWQSGNWDKKNGDNEWSDNPWQRKGSTWQREDSKGGNYDKNTRWNDQGDRWNNSKGNYRYENNWGDQQRRDNRYNNWSNPRREEAQEPRRELKEEPERRERRQFQLGPGADQPSLASKNDGDDGSTILTRSCMV